MRQCKLPKIELFFKDYTAFCVTAGHHTLFVSLTTFCYVCKEQKCERGKKRKSKKPLMGGRGGGDRATNFAHMWSKNVVEMEAQANCKGETQQKL